MAFKNMSSSISWLRNNKELQEVLRWYSDHTKGDYYPHYGSM